MNFLSLLDRFPNQIPHGFLIRESIGPYAVEFCDVERIFKGTTAITQYRIVVFFDESDSQIAAIYSGKEFYLDKSNSRLGERVTPERFFDFMLAEYPSIAEWLLWNL